MNEKTYDLTVKSENTEKQLVEVDGVNMIADLTERQLSYCSMTPKTDEEKATLYNIMNNPDKRIKDCINEVIKVKNVFVEVVKCTNQETGEVSTAPRIVLIDENGIGYQCVSLGIFSALKKLFAVYGEPTTWTKPIPIKIKQISKGVKNLLTLNVDTK